MQGQGAGRTESPLCRHKGSLRARDPAGDQLQARGLACTPGVRGTVGGVSQRPGFPKGQKALGWGGCFPGLHCSPSNRVRGRPAVGGMPVGAGGSTRPWFPASGPVKIAAAQLMAPTVWVRSPGRVPSSPAPTEGLPMAGRL